jgi:flagellar hook-length control protein FliK
MGIELQSSPQGHHKVSDARTQTNKPGDANQSDSTLGFAALMSMMAPQEPESASAPDTLGASLSPLGSDGALALSNANAAFVGVQLADSTPFALPFVAQPSATCTSPLDGPGLVPLLGGVAAPGTTQSGLDLSAGVSGGRLLSGAVSLPVGTDTALVTSPGVVTFVENEAQPPGILALVAAVPMGALVPALATLQPEQAPAKVPRTAADQSKVWTGSNQFMNSQEPNGQMSSPMSAQISTLPTDGPQDPIVALKPGGVMNLQQVTLAAQTRQDSVGSTYERSEATGSSTAALLNPGFALTSQETGIRISERNAKHLANRFGLGSDGVYGQPVASTNPSDALFQVPSTSAAAASTVVAETVSYWASQGIQNASMQLDGFGDEPVEVRISVNGDMAQVDFRTNQPEVRLAIEGAASQLKDMLSSQGMQLAGMSIGTSGQGGSQDKGSKAPSDARKLTLAKPEAAQAARVRPANPSVGQSLDLFV